LFFLSSPAGCRVACAAGSERMFYLMIIINASRIKVNHFSRQFAALSLNQAEKGRNAREFITEPPEAAQKK